MNKCLVFLIIGLVLVWTCYQPADQSTNAADVAAINQLWNQYAIAENTGDIDLWISLWTDDGIRMPPDRPAIKGKEQIRATMKNFLDQYSLKVAVQNEEVEVSGELG
jgi:uncharacterized protein (TIGR02246 family)